MKVADVERAISRPVSEWVGNCYGIALELHDAVDTEGSPVEDALPPVRRVVYGHYLGPVADDRAYRGGVLQHGWIALEDGRVCDPTRWAFLGHEPFIYVGSGEDYDEGGNVLRERMLEERGRPEYDPDDLVHLPVGLTTALWLQREFGTPKPDGVIGRKQAVYAANRSPSVLGEIAADLYRGLVAADLGAFVPLDNRRKVLG